jgi:hypothetical protein
MVCNNPLLHIDDVLTRGNSGHDTPKEAPLCNRRLGYHQQVRIHTHLAFPSTHARRTGSKPRTWDAGNCGCFSNVRRETKHTKPATWACRSTLYPSRTVHADTVAQYDANVQLRGSKFLKSWMAFLEENADLRYPNLADVYVDEQNG